MKKAIVTGGTKNLFFAMATLALNLKKTSPNICDEFVILHDGIKTTEQKKLMAAVSSNFSVRFIEYFPPANIDLTDGVKNTWTSMLLCKLECFKLLSDYNVVMW